MLLLLAFSLFRPDFWRDQVFPAFEFRPAVQLQADLSVRAEGESLRIRIESENERGEFAERTVLLAMPPDSGDRLSAMGFSTVPDGDALKVTDVGFSSPAEQAGLEAAFTRRKPGLSFHRCCFWAVWYAGNGAGLDGCPTEAVGSVWRWSIDCERTKAPSATSSSIVSIG